MLKGIHFLKHQTRFLLEDSTIKVHTQNNSMFVAKPRPHLKIFGIVEEAENLLGGLMGACEDDLIARRQQIATGIHW